MNSQGGTHHLEFRYHVTGLLALSLKTLLILWPTVVISTIVPPLKDAKFLEDEARLLLWSQRAFSQWVSLGMQRPLRWELYAWSTSSCLPICHLPQSHTSYISISFLMMLLPVCPPHHSQTKLCRPSFLELALLPTPGLCMCSAQWRAASLRPKLDPVASVCPSVRPLTLGSR